MSRMFVRGASFPSAPLVFLLVAVISLLQFPSNLFLRTVSIPGGIIINEIVFILGLPLTVVLALHYDIAKIFPLKAPKTATVIASLLLAVPVAMLIDYGAAASEAVFPMPERYHELMDRLMSFSGNWEFVLKLFVLCILPGICEELFFRGFCQTSLETRWGADKAMFITALLFALLHANPWYFHLYFLLGLFLSWVYARSRTLWIPVICHIVNNAWTFVNHALGNEYPLRGAASSVDLSLVIGGAAAVVIFGHLFKRSLTVTSPSNLKRRP